MAKSPSGYKPLMAFAAATEQWKVIQSAKICGIGQESCFIGKVETLDRAQFVSVLNAVAHLNRQEELGQTTPNFCIVFSAKKGNYYILYKKEFEVAALALVPDSKNEKVAAAVLVGVGRSISCFCGLVQAFLESMEKHGFDARKLAGAHSCELTDRYEVVRQLGAGAMGTAHLVRRKGREELFVAKETQDLSYSGRADFKDEFEMMRSLRHPNCLKVMELLETKDKELFIVSEFAHGGDLYCYMHEALAKEGLTEGMIAGLFQQAMQGVAFLHAKGYSHNDLKPDNLLVMEKFQAGATPRVVIADFGCARKISDCDPQFGDPRYLAPECMGAFKAQVMEENTRARGKSGPKADIWSMGATLFELLSGGSIPFLYEQCTLPIEGDDFTRLADAVLGPEALDDSRVSDMPREAVLLLKNMLHKNPAMRCDASQTLESPWFSAHESKLSDRVFNYINKNACGNRLRQVLLTALAAKLHYEHVEKCHRTFCAIDTDKSGTISRDEFVKACGLLDDRMSEDEAGCLFDGADIDGSKCLEFNEFAALTLDWQSLGTEVCGQGLEDLVSDIGVCSNGRVDIRKLADFCEGALKREQLHETLKGLDKMDTNTVKGSISMEAFMTFICPEPQHPRAARKRCNTWQVRPRTLTGADADATAVSADGTKPGSQEFAMQKSRSANRRGSAGF